MLKKEGERFVRIKKRDVKPYITLELKDAIYRLGYITSTPVKDVCEALCRNALLKKQVIEELSNYFRRDIRINNTVYLGDLEKPRIHTKKMAAKTERISLRLDTELYEFLGSLSYALDCSVSRVTAILLERGMHDVAFIDDYVNSNLHICTIDERRKQELQKILDFINEELEEEFSIATLLSLIVDEFKETTKTTKDAIGDFIQHWRK